MTREEPIKLDTWTLTNGKEAEAWIVKEKLQIRALGSIHNIDLPNAQPKTGHWIDNKCSACGKGIEDLIDSREWYENEDPKYCSFCGVKLVDPQESEKQTNDKL